MIIMTLVAMFIDTFEFHVCHFIAHKPVNISELNFFVALALFRTRVVSHSPWLDAFSAEQALATAALSWITDDEGADGTDEELGFFLLFIGAVQLIDVEMVASSLLGFVVWFWLVRKPVRILLV
tara:strand:+ start:38 stop:409 length:372 start_codon:yes stop_codon:yes gene_type:complete